MTSDLARRTCTPCRGGIPPMLPEDARRHAKQIPDWDLDADATRIERRFTFPDFARALAFVDRIGALAEAEGHHPDIRFGWGYCTVILYTHKTKGLHENDFILAAKIDALAPA